MEPLNMKPKQKSRTKKAPRKPNRKVVTKMEKYDYKILDKPRNGAVQLEDQLKKLGQKGWRFVTEMTGKDQRGEAKKEILLEKKI